MAAAKLQIREVHGELKRQSFFRIGLNGFYVDTHTTPRNDTGIIIVDVFYLVKHFFADFGGISLRGSGNLPPGLAFRRKIDKMRVFYSVQTPFENSSGSGNFPAARPSIGFGRTNIMREFTIGKNDAGQRLDRFAAKTLPLLPPALLQKYIRLKRIKVNGKGSQRDARLTQGDILQMYINDEFFGQPDETEDRFYSLFRPSLDIVYEDENLLLVNKRPGLVVHADETEKVNTLIHHIQAYLYQKKEWDPRKENSFAPALCNRIDRNTGGIVIAAKNAEALRIIDEKIRSHEIRKTYLCIALGRPSPAEGRIEGFLLKDEAKKQVSFYHHPVPGGKTAVTLYRTLKTQGELSLVECELLTGRTHQIRVSMAEIGHPLLGDGKYGNGQINKKYHEQKQALYSYRLLFDFAADSGSLEYLRGKTFTISDIPFEKRYFH